MIIAVLAVLGLSFGSFINALVWRTKKKFEVNSAKLIGRKKTTNYKLQTTNYSIFNGRSICPGCRHVLAWYDLVPVLSWLALRGRCRYCQKPISIQYPIIELTGAAVFLLSYIYWPANLHSGGQIILFIAWLACSVGLLALLVYDLKWMLLPSNMLYPTLVIAVAGKLAYLIGYEPHKLHSAIMWGLSVLVASGIFWLIFMVSGGKWIGYGDVRLGWVTGTLLQTPAKSLLMIFLASLIGTLLILPLIGLGKRRLSAKLPYGPFLITAAFICLLFGDQILNWYKATFLP